MKGFEKFQLAMIEAGKSHILPWLEKHQDAVGEAITNQIFSLSGPTAVSQRLSHKDRFFAKMFRGFLKISKSFETLEDISYYVGRFPFQRARIKPERYLQFHVEAYLAEIYILRERLTGYLKIIERQHKKDPRLASIRTRCKRLCDLITTALQGVVDLRGRHVHEARFTDEDIDRLGTTFVRSQRTRKTWSPRNCVGASRRP